MRELDEQEINIARELVKNARFSDNQISKNTGIPLKTVNTKRKKLESEGILRYYVDINNTETGTGLYNARHLYKVYFSHGISRKQFMEKWCNIICYPAFRKHLYQAFLGEEQGHLVLFLVFESYREKDIHEIYNAEFVPLAERIFGQRCIFETQTTILREHLRLFNNYLPLKNMKNGRITAETSNEELVIYEK
ncbi:MAG: Lrp/AsnC family transcriptional regulator [Candidatus Woesearchaeota archaeon]